MEKNPSREKLAIEKIIAQSVDLKEHIALDRSSWSLKSVCNRLV